MVKINLQKRQVSFIILVTILLIGGGFVYAQTVGTTPNPGHSLIQLQSVTCPAGQFLRSVGGSSQGGVCADQTGGTITRISGSSQACFTSAGPALLTASVICPSGVISGGGYYHSSGSYTAPIVVADNPSLSSTSSRYDVAFACTGTFSACNGVCYTAIAYCLT